MPGWDGVLSSERGNAWVPAGASRWEIGCDKDVTGKANGDYEKRTQATSPEERAACTFVFVTPRRWVKKNAWVDEHAAKGDWAGVRACDADDLEQWLEQTPAVALMVGEEMGLSGFGVASPARYWHNWSRQCEPAITTDALYMDRSATQAALSEKLRAAQEGKISHNLLTLRADSVEEAAAFAVAVVMTQGTLSDESLVVTGPQGWQYVESNPRLRIAIAARTETAASPVLRDGLLVIVPQATGDLAHKDTSEELLLDRPNIYDFEKSLIAIGMEESDARRYAASTGRSWTIFRRQRASNPAIRNPVWLDSAQSFSLPLLCLVGCWHASHDGDRQAVERLARRAYEDIEEDLCRLARLDDAPVLKIGDVWKAKSPLELMNQFGDQITGAQLDRFFALAQDMLTAADPQLELPAEERWMVNVHGKVRPFSGLLFDSVCDSLLKLAVRGIELPALQFLELENRVDRFVQQLLGEADAERWLSLASHLPTLAEAAPDAFLSAVEKSLRKADAPVARLITESGDSGFMGRCWHAGLLWALETLAWAPNRLARVALILAQLTHVPMKGNWGNKPSVSLFGLFRSWYPQTAASLQDRIRVLKLLIQRDGDVAFDILRNLAGPLRSRTALPAQRPKWRDDDAGAGHGVSRAEMFEMASAAREELIAVSKGHASRTAVLLNISMISSKSDLATALGLVELFTIAPIIDNDCELLRTALRKFMCWYTNHSDLPPHELGEWIGPARTCYELLMPRGFVLRHQWLFETYWVELPDFKCAHDEAYDKAVKTARLEAIADIFDGMGMPGIRELISTCKQPDAVGSHLIGALPHTIQWPEWIAMEGGDFLHSQMTSCISGLLGSMKATETEKTFQSIIQLEGSQNWSPQKMARLLNLVSPREEIWKLAEACGHEVEEHYWRIARPYCHSEAECSEYIINRLLAAKRPNAALKYCRLMLNKVDATLLFKALQQFVVHNEGEDSPSIQHWNLPRMIEKLEKSGQIEPIALMQLEFQLFPALVQGDRAASGALYECITSKPELFVELVCALYKPEHGERTEPITESQKLTAERAFDIFHYCSRLPGTKSDGSINGEIFSQFITTARQLCRDADRATMGDQTLGQILAHSPTDEDGTWPFVHACKILDSVDAEEIRTGFYFGAWNKRGVTSRSPWDGGGQERDLAAHYRSQAQRVQSSFPNVAAMLEKLARSYERMGREEDIEANLRKEGF